jgi:16S rRNA processing protein RimM
MDQSHLLEVGRIAKAHGLRGEVVVALGTDVTERLAPGSVLSTDTGPLVVRSARPHQHRWIVDFVGVSDRAAADELRGMVLRAEPVADEGALWVHELIGAEVRTIGGRSCGRVEAVEANPASDLMVLPGGVLVPVAFIVDETDLPERVVIDPPDGLLEDEV